MSRKSLAVLLICLAAVGCGGEADNRPARSPVRGVVKYKGQPVEGASIVFSPTAPNLPAAAGTTDAQGNYVLKTFDDGDGAVPGTYQVGISKTKSDGTTVIYTEEPPPDYDPSAPPPKSTDLLPKKYKIAAKSGLTATVVEGENPPIDFDLKD